MGRVRSRERGYREDVGQRPQVRIEPQLGWATLVTGRAILLKDLNDIFSTLGVKCLLQYVLATVFYFDIQM